MLRRIAPTAVVAALGLALSSVPADAEPTPTCSAWEVEYALSANLTLRDTIMGAGDGTYVIGPGTTVLRFEGPSVGPGPARMLSYGMKEQFTIHSKALFWKASVYTDTRTKATPDACSIAAEGIVNGRTLRWTTPVRGYHTDGTLTCEGSLCGQFGAPPAGKSELHHPPRPVPFSAFQFTPDMKAFSMVATQVTKTESPKQTGYLGLAGREMKRTCVTPKACR